MNFLKRQHSGLELLVGPVGGSARCVRLLLLAVLMLGWAGLTVANDCHVTPTGTGDGSSWSSPAHLQDALGNLPCSKIKVAEGTYYAPEDGFSHEGDNSHRVVEGGWKKISPVLDEWKKVNDPSLTVFSGGEQERVLTIRAQSGNVGSDTRFENLTIADGDSGVGGGVYITAGSQRICSPTFRQVSFIGNQASIGGGAVSISAADGSWSNPMFIDVNFAANKVEGGKEAGGAVYLTATGSGSSAPKFVRVRFEENVSQKKGGAVHAETSDGGGLVEPDFTDTVFLSNHAGWEGGAFSARAYKDGIVRPFFERASFRDNHAETSGGAISALAFEEDGVVETVLTNVSLMDNSAQRDGGGFYNYSQEGGKVLATVRYSTFARNHAVEKASAAYTIAWDGGSESETIFDSTVFWDNDASQFPAVMNYAADRNEAIAKSHFSHSLIQGSGGSGSGGEFWDIDDHGNGSYDDGNNVDADPLFEYLGFSNGGRVETVAFYSDQSAAFNGGDEGSCPDTDARGKPRPARGGCDIGAFEYQLSDKGPLIFNDRFENADP